MIILPDTTLCAIVRDEMFNPAGGIKDFVNSIVPFVEQAVIVDTGSEDGTREVLEELEAQYPNLKIYDHEFNGFGPSRNFSLRQVQTKRALILDADERIEPREIIGLKAYLEKYPERSLLDLVVQNISPEDPKNDNIACTYSRIVPKRTRFKGKVWETIDLEPTREEGLYCTHFKILHFLPKKEGLRNKRLLWYGGYFVGREQRDVEKIKAPSGFPRFSTWKSYNPRRDEYVI